MRYYYERDNDVDIYYIIDRYSEEHICDCFSLRKVQWVVDALNQFEERRMAESYTSIY